jgi:hypothetical protein
VTEFVTESLPGDGIFGKYGNHNPCTCRALRFSGDVRDVEVASSNLVAPTIFQNEPFGENIEGLSYLREKSQVDELKVQWFSCDARCKDIVLTHLPRSTALASPPMRAVF